MDLSGLAQKSMSTLSLRGTISNTDPLLPFAWIEKCKDGKWRRLPEHEQEQLEACFTPPTSRHRVISVEHNCSAADSRWECSATGSCRTPGGGDSAVLAAAAYVLS